MILASAGYPGPYETGRPISGLEEAARLPDVAIFHAGTRLVDGQVVTSGGRVLAVTALGEDVPAARARAYEAVARIGFEGAHHRSDIGARRRTT